MTTTTARTARTAKLAVVARPKAKVAKPVKAKRKTRAQINAIVRDGGVRKRVQLARAIRNGITDETTARMIWDACRLENVPFWVGCNVAMRESGGGKNIWGHDQVAIARSGKKPYIDRMPMWGAGQVTEAGYRWYKAERNRQVVLGVGGYRAQGVGPGQATFWALQDAADRLGGCWIPLNSMRVCMDLVARLRQQHDGDWHAVWKSYNGGDEYADAMTKSGRGWRQVMAA